MSDGRTRPVAVTVLGMLHIVLGSLVALALLVDLALGIAGGIPLFALVRVALAAFLGPVVGRALLEGRPWSWHLASFGYVALAIGGWFAVPPLLDNAGWRQLPGGTTPGITLGAIAVAALLALLLFTGSVVDHFSVARRARWLSLGLEVAVAVGLLFGVKQLIGMGPPREEMSVELQRLGEIRANAPGEIELMLDRLENGSVDERVSAAWALGRSGRGDVMPRLLEASRDDSNVNVRINAIHSVAELGGQEIQADLLELLQDDETEIRLAALRGLADERFAGAVEEIGRVLVESDELRSAAVDVLGNLGRPEAVPFLQQAAADPQEDVRSRVAFALGKLRDPRALPTLIEMLEDQRWPVRANAANALGMIGDPSARSALEGMRTDPSEQVRGAAESALRKLP